MLSIRSTLGFSLLAALAPLIVSRPALAETPQVLAEEIREFEILVKGKPAGRSQLRITDSSDGSTVVATDASVKLNFIVHIYRYEFHGREIWRQGHLRQVDNRAVDDGKQFAMRATIDADRSIVDTGSEPARPAPAPALTTNYWRLPDAWLTEPQFFLLDADRGSISQVKLRRLEADRVDVEGHKIACTHWQLEGGVRADLWFDAQNRLVGQQTVEDGYSTELRLVRLARAAPHEAPALQTVRRAAPTELQR